MKTKLSGLMDGELAGHEAQDLFGALSQDKELRGRWLEYQLIGDALKGERHLDTELTARVMAGLEAEPTIIAPQQAPSYPAVWHRNALALAATVAGVAVVGWLALGTAQLPQPETVAQSRTSPVSPANLAMGERRAVPAMEGRTSAVAAQSVRQASPDMQEYLIAHEAQSSLLQFRGGAAHIRTVATVGTAPAK